MRANTYTNPVYPGYFADPFVWNYEGVYYAVGTGPSSSESEGPKRFPLLRSEDMVNWQSVGHALLPIDAEFGEHFWAPEVAYSDGRFYLHYSIGRDGRHHMRVAVSDRPEGPYEDVGEPVNDTLSCPFAIDSHAFQDDDGQWYLFYARDFLDSDNGVRPGTALAVDRLIDMVKLAGEERVVARARSDWQRFKANRSMYDGIYDWHTLEGPAVRKHDGRYYCFYSGGCYENDSYGVDYAVSDNVMGPYSDAGSEGGPRVLKTSPGRVIGPGHNSIVLGPDGKTDYIVYHAWDAAMTARRMCIDKLVWKPEGPRCLGPTWTPQDI